MTGRSRCEHYTHKPASRQLQESELCRHTRADVVDPEHRACSGALGQNSSGCRSDIARTRRMAAEAKRQGRERFHPDVVARRHLDIYRELLGRS